MTRPPVDLAIHHALPSRNVSALSSLLQYLALSKKRPPPHPIPHMPLTAMIRKNVCTPPSPFTHRMPPRHGKEDTFRLQLPSAISLDALSTSSIFLSPFLPILFFFALSFFFPFPTLHIFFLASGAPLQFCRCLLDQSYEQEVVKYRARIIVVPSG